jgi:hypothetical protein
LDDHAFVMTSELRSFVFGALHRPADAANDYQNDYDQRHGRDRPTDQQRTLSFLLGYFLTS